MRASIHSAVGAVLEIFRWHYTLIGIAVAFLVFWDPINSWWNFQAATVEVKAVSARCAAIGPIPLEVDDCDTLRQRHQNKTGIQIKPRTFVSFDYVSPVDGKSYSYTLVRERDDSGQAVHPGSRITVRLSRRSPTVLMTQ